MNADAKIIFASLRLRVGSQSAVSIIVVNN